MARVLLQPRGAVRVRGPENFDKSIRRGLLLSEYRQWIGAADQQRLEAVFGARRIQLWGSTPTAYTGNDKAVALRERRAGDLVLFYAEKSFIAHARIAHLFRNRALAQAIWGTDDEGETWEHVMALTDVAYVNVPSERILVPLGQNPVVRGLALLSQSDSDQVISILGLGAPPPAALSGHRRDSAGGNGPATEGPSRVPDSRDRDDREALDLLRSLIGVPLETLAGRPNRILSVEGTVAQVATERSPGGQPVPVEMVTAGLARLKAAGAVRVHPDELGHRSAFVGAVLATLPGTVATRDPAVVRLQDPTANQIALDPQFAVLDGLAQVRIRKEQGVLRRLLVGDRSRAECDLCRREYDLEFLVAAHIKRRSVCTDDERNDFRNIAMLACVFGCDRLYEAGYVTVGTNGIILATEREERLQRSVSTHLDRLDGEQCGAHRPETEKYFKWHRDNIFRAKAAPAVAE